MMRAVLDSNFWLATHVVIITIGYSTTFLAGFLGIAYVFYHLKSVVFRQPEGKLKKTLESMIFGITCFSLLFSLVGTVLGGIWADQSWGRFWGWDAKENGALLIVIWNALLLHARFSGIARTRGLATIAIFGNIVTAWSWFGTNMLGVGLHSYGFMDKAFNSLDGLHYFPIGHHCLGLCSRHSEDADQARKQTSLPFAVQGDRSLVRQLFFSLSPLEGGSLFQFRPQRLNDGLDRSAECASKRNAGVHKPSLSLSLWLENQNNKFAACILLGFKTLDLLVTKTLLGPPTPEVKAFPIDFQADHSKS